MTGTDMSNAPTRCIECGGSVGFLNEDEDGKPCPACAERLLETLPGVFHQPWDRGSDLEPETVADDSVAADGFEESESSEA